MSVPKFKSAGAPVGGHRPPAPAATPRDLARNALTVDEQLPMMEEGEGPTDAELRAVADKAREIVQLENTNASLGKQIKQNLDRIKVLEEVELPAAMRATGQTEAPLNGGYKAKVEDFVSAHILADNKAPAYMYVRREGGADLIKTEVTVSLPMGCEALAKRVLAAIKKVPAVAVKIKKGKKWVPTKLTPEQANGAPLALAESIHQGTLTRWVKDRKEAGKAVDPNYVTVYEGTRAWVERPKATAPTDTGM